MKFFIGRIIGTIGAKLWKNGGWTETSSYEDLKITGKIGYLLFIASLSMMGIIPKDLKERVHEQNEKGE